MNVAPIDKVADLIWEAVSAAIQAGVTPQKFKREAAEAWKHELAEQGKEASRELQK